MSDTTDIYIFNHYFGILSFFFTYLSYLFILYIYLTHLFIYLFIYLVSFIYLLFSAVRYQILQTPLPSEEGAVNKRQMSSRGSATTDMYRQLFLGY